LDSGALHFDFLEDLGNALESLGRCSLCAEKLAELLSLLVVVRRVPGDVSGLAVEEVWIDVTLANRSNNTVGTKHLLLDCEYMCYRELADGTKAVPKRA
jgi:hypothetical protein